MELLFWLLFIYVVFIGAEFVADLLFEVIGLLLDLIGLIGEAIFAAVFFAIHLFVLLLNVIENILDSILTDRR